MDKVTAPCTIPNLLNNSRLFPPATSTMINPSSGIPSSADSLLTYSLACAKKALVYSSSSCDASSGNYDLVTSLLLGAVAESGWA